MRAMSCRRFALIVSSAVLSTASVAGAGCSEQQVVVGTDAGDAGSLADAAAPADTSDAEAADAGWSGCAAVSAVVCDDFDKPDNGSWTRFVADGGTLEIAQGQASSPPGFLHTVLPPAGAFPSVDVRLAQIFENAKTTSIDYSAHVRVVRRSAGRVSTHEIVASDVKWRLAIELSAGGDKVIEETATERRSSPLSRQLPDNTWVLLRVRATLGLPAKPAVVSLDGVDVATHVTSPPGGQFVTLYVGQRPASSEAGEGIVDIDNVVARRGD